MKFYTRCVLLAGAPFLMPCAAFADDDPQQPVQSSSEESDDIIVQATRSGRRIQDEPVRVEVVNREEIEEKILMRPGNIAMIVSETGGLRVQVTSPALGSANIRVQGMEGRYTQLLADGLPLYGGQASSLGLLQIPPTDLGQVEVIKGAASALYGPSALGGVINLVSRRPNSDREAEALLNITSRGGQDATAYVAAPLADGWSASLTGGFHRQDVKDIDHDGWADMPGYTRWAMRPRVFWSGGEGEELFLTAGAMTEDRRGGTLRGRSVPDGSAFPQAQDTRRFDVGVVAKTPLNDIWSAHLRASGMTQKHHHRYGDVRDSDRHSTIFTEASLAGKIGEASAIVGLAYQRDTFRSRAFSAFDYGYTVPGVFAQIEHDLTPEMSLAGSARVDFHNRFGTQFSPRLSFLYKPGAWTIRVSGGRGFYAPTPFVEEVDAAGLSFLEPLQDLKAESATTASMDIGYKQGPLEANVTLFGSNMRNTTQLVSVGTPEQPRVHLVNVAGTTRTRGAEMLLRYRHGDLNLTGSYVYVHSQEPNPDGVGRREVPLTPKHTAGVVAMWEKHDKGRLGVEIYYTGRQSLDDNPYRTRSRSYFEIGMMGEIAVGKARLFLNAENILGVRQTKYDRLLRPARGADGRWTVDAWAPLEGFVLNGGVRLRFGGHE